MKTGVELMRAVGYVRVSTEEQVQEGNGLEIQRSEITSYCKKNRIELVEIFEDAGISGSNGLDKRAGLKAMFEYLQEHKDIDTVVVYKYDRLSRDLFLQLFLEKELKKMNVRIVSITEEHLSKDDYISNLMRQLIGAFAEFEKNRIAERLLSGRKHKARTEQSYASSYYPFGYTQDGRVIPEHAEIVRQAFVRYSNGESLQDIADWLNSLSIATKRGGQWSRQSVRNMLTNRVYMGRVKWGEFEAVRDDLQIVPEALFNKVQRKLSGKEGKPRIVVVGKRSSRTGD